jgi:hypothetical protein
MIPPLKAEYDAAPGQPMTPHSDEIATMRPTVGRAYGLRPPDQPGCPQQVHRQGTVPTLGLLLERKRHRHERVVRHENLDRHQACGNFSYPVEHRVGVGDVKGRCDSPDSLGDVCGRRGIQVVASDPRTLAGEARRDRGARTGRTCPVTLKARQLFPRPVPCLASKVPKIGGIFR